MPAARSSACVRGTHTHGGTRQEVPNSSARARGAHTHAAGGALPGIACFHGAHSTVEQYSQCTLTFRAHCCLRVGRCALAVGDDELFTVYKANFDQQQNDAKQLFKNGQQYVKALEGLLHATKAFNDSLIVACGDEWEGAGQANDNALDTAMYVGS